MDLDLFDQSDSNTLAPENDPQAVSISTENSSTSRVEPKIQGGNLSAIGEESSAALLQTKSIISIEKTTDLKTASSTSLEKSASMKKVAPITPTMKNTSRPLLTLSDVVESALRQRNLKKAEALDAPVALAVKAIQEFQTPSPSLEVRNLTERERKEKREGRRFSLQKPGDIPTREERRKPIAIRASPQQKRRMSITTNLWVSETKTASKVLKIRVTFLCSAVATNVS